MSVRASPCPSCSPNPRGRVPPLPFGVVGRGPHGRGGQGGPHRDRCQPFPALGLRSPPEGPRPPPSMAAGHRPPYPPILRGNPCGQLRPHRRAGPRALRPLWSSRRAVEASPPHRPPSASPEHPPSPPQPLSSDPGRAKPGRGCKATPRSAPKPSRCPCPPVSVPRRAPRPRAFPSPVRGGRSGAARERARAAASRQNP